MLVTGSVALLSVLLTYNHQANAAITAWIEPASESATATGTYSFPEHQEIGDLSKGFNATGDGTVTYTLLTTDTPFSVASGGALSLESALDFETKSSFEIQVKATDSNTTTTPTTGIATITINVTDINEAPAFAETTYSVCINDNSTPGTTLTTASATDQDSGDVITYDFVANQTDFNINGTSGAITVATGKTISSGTTASYEFVVKATDDDGTTPLSGTATYSVKVKSECSSANVMTLSVALLTMLHAIIRLLS